jgi:hypothetical protein
MYQSKSCSCGENTLAEFTVPGFEEGVAPMNTAWTTSLFNRNPTFYDLIGWLLPGLDQG